MKRKYGRDWYRNMSGEYRQKLKEYEKNYWEVKNDLIFMYKTVKKMSKKINVRRYWG